MQIIDDTALIQVLNQLTPVVIVDESEDFKKLKESLIYARQIYGRCLKKLEDNVGAELFDRKSYPLKLTLAGELFLKYVIDIADKTTKLKQDLQDIHENTMGKIIVGITPWRSSTMLPNVLTPHVVFETENIETAINMAATNIGVTFVPEAFIECIKRMLCPSTSSLR